MDIGRSQETDRNVSCTEIIEYDTTQSDNAVDTSDALTDKGGRHGRGFGRGTYGCEEVANDFLDHWFCDDSNVAHSHIKFT
jgi:hypothetical protein